MKRVSLVFLLLFLLCFKEGFSQNNVSKRQLKEYRNNPVWITMMDDSTVNYHEAKTAFDEFWRGKPTPEELNEGEVEGEEEHERNIVSRMLKSDKRYKAEIVQYSFEHRKFKYWLRKNEPYVREDGSIMSQGEQDYLLNQELANRNAATNSK